MPNLIPTKYPGFYHIPGYKRFGISKDQEVINLETGKILKRMYTRNKYIRVHTEFESQRTSAVHRLMAQTFLDPPEDPRKNQVNHINGNVQDNSIENLEWVTPQENDEHAGRTGLSPKCLPIEVRDVTTGEIREYPSYISYAREVGMSKDKIRYRILHGKRGVVCFPEMKQYRLKSNLSWPVEKNIAKPDRSVSVDIRDLKTGEVRHYERMIDAAQFLGYSLSGFWTRLRHISQPIFGARYQAKYSVDKTWREPGDMILENASEKFVKAVQVYNPSTGENRVFNSCLTCARKLGILPTTLNWRLKDTSGTPKSDGRIYGYYPIRPDLSVPFERLET